MPATLLQPKTLAFLVGVGLVLTLVIVNLQIQLTGVSAQVIPVVVSEDSLDFGTVFPGEELEGNFIVSYSEEFEGNGVNYRIIQKRKPLPPEHPEYPNGGDPDLPGYYRNLCPFLTKVTNEGEGDIESGAFVGPDDLSDAWVIYFSVPAIFGFVGQDHTGGVVNENGEYGCDVSIDIIEEQLSTAGFTNP